MANHVAVSDSQRRSELSAAMPLELVHGAVSKQMDPFGVVTSLLNAQMAWMLHPLEFGRALNSLTDDLFALQTHVLQRAMGIPREDVIQPNADDSRFADSVWNEAPTWDIVKEVYLAFTRHLQDMYYETPGLSDRERRRSAFWLRKWLNAVAPTNFFWANPVALRKYVETNGQSLVQGLRHFLSDLNTKTIPMVEPDAFVVGRDLAYTPGEVVFRNELVEVIHFTPSTAKVKSVPIVIITPWINKYYVLDLTAKKSMVRYMVDQGFSVFITSWKNPGEDMADTRFDDYLEHGVHQVVEVARAYCKVPQVHLAGYCIGGTLVTTYMAWANRRFGADKMPVADWTLFTTLTDFSHPGDIEVFIDEATVSALEQSMAQKGYLDGAEMASSFRLLRSNSLVWYYWVQRYLYGETLPAFDVLYWNMDTTRMPAAMHAFYLREMYLHNNLMKRDRLTIAGEPIDLDRITQPLYAVTAEDDHIAPWKQCYRIRKYVNVATPVRFVLSSSGHILGIVNPPSNPPKRTYRVGEPERNQHWERWLEGAESCQGTWWDDWVNWLAARSGKDVAPPKASAQYPALMPAPGQYVLEK